MQHINYLRRSTTPLSLGRCTSVSTGNTQSHCAAHLPALATKSLQGVRRTSISTGGNNVSARSVEVPGLYMQCRPVGQLSIQIGAQGNQEIAELNVPWLMSRISSPLMQVPGDARDHMTAPLCVHHCSFALSFRVSLRTGAA